MKRYLVLFTLCCLLPLLGAVCLWAAATKGQGKDTEVRNQIRQAQVEITRINTLLGTTRREQGATLSQLRLIEARLQSRQTVVRGLESEITTVTQQMEGKSAVVDSLRMRQAELRRNYAALLRIAYKNYRNNSYLSFLFSARDFTDAAQRLYYVKRIGAESQRMTQKLDVANQTLGVQLAVLGQRKNELGELQQEHAREAMQLTAEEGQLKKTQTALRSKEKALLSEAEKRRRQLAQLEQQLQRIVAEEVQRNAAANRGNKSGAKQGSTTVSPLTAQFEQRRGQLLRPVEGVIVDRYGLHDHPTQKGVKINNKGINMAARERSEVQSVFGGEVRKVFFFQGLGNAVMLRHGSYLTIYANLGELFVREGDSVLEGQALGSLASASVGEQATLHFEVWRESNNLNPEEWIRR